MFNRVCKRIINIAYCVIFSFILFTVLFISSRLEYWYKAQGIVNNVVSLIVGFTLILFLWSLIKIFSDKIDNALKAIKVIGIAVFVLQIIFANEIYFITDWDAGTVNYISSALLYKIPLDEWQTYYIKMYPNNLIIAIIEYIIKYVASIFNFDEYFSLIVVGIMSANIAMYYTAKTVYILTSSKTVTYLSYSLSLILFGFSPWIVIPYSDAYSILLPIASIYCYLMHKKKSQIASASWTPA